MGGESAESRQQWAEDMDVDVSSLPSTPRSSTMP